jgi:hypothetical protein
MYMTTLADSPLGLLRPSPHAASVDAASKVNVETINSRRVSSSGVLMPRGELASISIPLTR